MGVRWEIWWEILRFPLNVNISLLKIFIGVLVLNPIILWKYCDNSKTSPSSSFFFKLILVSSDLIFNVRYHEQNSLPSRVKRKCEKLIVTFTMAKKSDQSNIN